MLVSFVAFSPVTHPFQCAERLIRINSVGSGLESEDLEQCVKEVATTGVLDAIVIPKVEDPSHLEFVTWYVHLAGSVVLHSHAFQVSE